MTKQELRVQIKTLLCQNKDFLFEQSEKICSKIISSKDFIQTEYIFAYMPLWDEVDIAPVIKEAFLQNKKVCIPKINLTNQTMDFYFNEQNNQKGAYGIMEPSDGAKKVDIKEVVLNTKKNILVLVPGRVFTKSGNRLGRGKGYYDKYFSLAFENLKETINKNKIILAGICFDEQIVGEEVLEVSDLDIKMNKIISCHL